MHHNCVYVLVQTCLSANQSLMLIMMTRGLGCGTATVPTQSHSCTIYCRTCKLRANQTNCIAVTISTGLPKCCMERYKHRAVIKISSFLGEYNKKVREFRQLWGFLFFWKLPGFLFMVVGEKHNNNIYFKRVTPITMKSIPSPLKTLQTAFSIVPARGMNYLLV